MTQQFNDGRPDNPDQPQPTDHADGVAGWMELATRPINRRAALKASAAVGGSLATLAVAGAPNGLVQAARSTSVRSAAAGADAKFLPPIIRPRPFPFPLPINRPVTLYSGLHGVIGCKYRLSDDQLFFVEFASGTLSRLTVHSHSYAVLGTGYSQPEDIALSADGVHAYVTERTGNLLRVNLTSANRSAATVVSTGMTAPQQISLDENNNRAYVVEYTSSGRLLSIDLGTGTQTTLINNLDHAVGVLVTRDGRTAYISEQAAGGGKVSRFDLTAGGSRTTLATGMAAPFYLTWSDHTQTLIYMADRDPANRVVMIDPSSTPATVTTLVSGVAFRPSSVAVLTADQLLICSDSVISQMSLSGSSYRVTGTMLLGIGFVPYNKIVGGLASTDPGYFFYVQNAPFGGQLPLMINHQRAYIQGARYYQVSVDGMPQNATWTDYLLDSSGNFVLQSITALSGDDYAIRPPTQTWFNPWLGFFVNTLGLTNDLHTITLDLYNTLGGPVVGHQSVVVLVDNSRCTAILAPPQLDSTSADPDCGVITYSTDSSGNPVGSMTLGFTASHPNNLATFSLSLIRGVTPVTLASASGPVSTAHSPITPAPTAHDLLGTCPVAGFAESLYVAATAINGWGRQGQYDASAQIAFVLAPPGCATPKVS